MKKVLIPTNFSPHSAHTIQYVLDLFKNITDPCQIILLNTYLIPTVDPSTIISLNDQLKDLAREGLQRELLAARELNRNPNITIDTACHMGSLESVLQQYLQRKLVDFVAICKSEDYNIESIEAVLSKYECPLLVTTMDLA